MAVVAGWSDTLQSQPPYRTLPLSHQATGKWFYELNDWSVKVHIGTNTWKSGREKKWSSNTCTYTQIKPVSSKNTSSPGRTLSGVHNLPRVLFNVQCLSGLFEYQHVASRMHAVVDLQGRVVYIAWIEQQSIVLAYRHWHDELPSCVCDSCTLDLPDYSLKRLKRLPCRSSRTTHPPLFWHGWDFSWRCSFPLRRAKFSPL